MTNNNGLRLNGGFLVSELQGFPCLAQKGTAGLWLPIVLSGQRLAMNADLFSMARNPLIIYGGGIGGTGIALATGELRKAGCLCSGKPENISFEL